MGAPNKLSAVVSAKAMTSAPRPRSSGGVLQAVSEVARAPSMWRSRRRRATPLLPERAFAEDAVDGREGRRDGRRRHRRRRRGQDSSPPRSMSSITCARRAGASKTASRGNDRMSSSSRARASRSEDREPGDDASPPRPCARRPRRHRHQGYAVAARPHLRQAGSAGQSGRRAAFDGLDGDGRHIQRSIITSKRDDAIPRRARHVRLRRLNLHDLERHLRGNQISRRFSHTAES